MKSLKKNCSPLKDKKSAMFFKFTNVIAELGGPPLVQDFALIYYDELEAEVSKLKDKWVGEFENLTNFSEEIIKEWILDCVNLNNNISIIVNEVSKEIMEIEK